MPELAAVLRSSGLKPNMAARVERALRAAGVSTPADREASAVKTCGNCRHWHPLAPQDRGAVDLVQRQVRQGECREQLHALPMIQPTQQGLQCVGWFSGYPPTAEAFPACGRYSPVVN